MLSDILQWYFKSLMLILAFATSVPIRFVHCLDYHAVQSIELSVPHRVDQALSSSARLVVLLANCFKKPCPICIYYCLPHLIEAFLTVRLLANIATLPIVEVNLDVFEVDRGYLRQPLLLNQLNQMLISRLFHTLWIKKKVNEPNEQTGLHKSNELIRRFGHFHIRCKPPGAIIILMEENVRIPDGYA